MDKTYHTSDEICNSFWNEHFPKFNDKSDNRIFKWRAKIIEYNDLQKTMELLKDHEVYNGQSFFYRTSTKYQIINATETFDRKGVKFYDGIPQEKEITSVVYLLVYKFIR